VIAQGNVVVVEAQGDNAQHDGRRYDNTCCWVCTFEGDQLREVIEYMDTDLVLRVLAPLPAPRS
jgi:ketosteroid isomerase-like protein